MILNTEPVTTSMNSESTDSTSSTPVVQMNCVFAKVQIDYRLHYVHAHTYTALSKLSVNHCAKCSL